MKISLHVFFIGMLLGGCAHRHLSVNPSAIKHSAPIPSLSPGAGPSPVPSPLATPEPRPTVQAPSAKIITLNCDETCLDSERKELPLIEADMNATLSGDCLTQYFMTPGRRIDNRNGLSPAQILAKLRQPTTLTLNYYYSRWSKGLGYESADDFSVIHFNRAKLAGWSTCEKGSLGAHEFTHTKGFFHNGNLAAPNYYTVPYQVNNAFEGNDDMAACCGKK